MSATVAGAVKARLESLGMGMSAFRDVAPPNQPLPYWTVQEGIGRAPEPAGDFGDPDNPGEVREEVQVDLWQARRKADGTSAEDYTLVHRTIQGLRGAVLDDVLGGRCYPARVTDSRRIPDPDANLIHDTITIQIVRALPPVPAP